jgi:hypothetical protein
MALAIGTLGKLAIAATGTSLASFTQCIEFISETMGSARTQLDLSGIRGTRSHPKERFRDGTYTVGGTLVLQPNPEEMAILLPYCLGAEASGTTFALAEDLPEFDVAIDKQSKVCTYIGCKVVQMNLKGSAGGPMTMELQIVGKTETVTNAGTFPSIVPNLTAPYVLYDGVFTVLSAARGIADIDISVQNVADTGRFLNSQTVTAIPILDRIVMVKATVPYETGNVDLQNQALAGNSATFVLTNGAYSSTWSFANLKAVTQATPVIDAKKELMLQLNYQAVTSSTTKELIVTHDSTP